MTDETQGAGQPDAEDTAAVLAHAAEGGEKTFLTPKDEQAAEAPEAKATPGEDDAPAAQPPEAEAAKPKPKQSAQERIDELTRNWREAERDRDFFKEQALRAKPAEIPAEEAQKTPDDGRPDPANYEGGAYDPAYIDHLTDWKAQAAVTTALANRDFHNTVTAKLESFTAKAAELYPDGEPDGLKAFRAIPTISAAIQQLLMESDIAPRVADHLGANPAELARLSGLAPALQGREFAKLETRLAEPAKPPPKTATDAPEPAPQARGSGGQFKVAADTDDFEAFERQHMPGR